ncbi:MAG: DUF6789 family protein [Xanthobacteraceae bacterium]
MPHSTKGVIAGLLATIVLSVAMLLQSAMGIAPQVDIIGLIDRLGSIGRGGAWADHFIVGTILWGALFAGLDFVTPRAPHWLKGLIFGAGAWLAMMLVFMPVVGAGLFGTNLGIAAPAVTLVLHLIYGAALGIAFSFVDTWAPVESGTGMPKA